MQITVDLKLLNVQEREDLAGFIMTFGVDLKQQKLPFTPTPTELSPTEVFALQPPAPPVAPPPPAPGPTLVAPQPPNPTVVGAESTAVEQNSVPVAGVDSKGLPWDERIHSSGKALSADGTWRKKRGVDETLVATVEAQLRALPAAGPVAVPSPPTTATPTAPPPPPTTATPAAPPPPATVTDQDARQKYVALIGRASAAIGAGKLLTTELDTILAQFQLTNLPMLGTELAKVDGVASAIDALLSSRA